MHDPTDPLSKAGRTVLALNDQAYRRLVVDSPGIVQARDILESTRAQGLVAGPVRDKQEADAMLAGLWLWHDFLDESHRIAQGIDTPTGSFWHAIMHRREGDFSNSKYWYNRCTNHPVLQYMAPQASGMINTLPADKSLLRLIATGWNPNAFVDLVEQVHDRADEPRHELAVSLQRVEWATLFSHCVREAARRGG